MFCYIVGEINYCYLFMNASANHSELGNLDVGATSRCFTIHICWVEAFLPGTIGQTHPKAALY